MKRTLLPFHNIYQCTGEQPQAELVLLHGWGLHSIVWDDIMPALLERFQVTVIDLPGMGQSPLPNQDYTLDFVVDQVVAVMPEKAHLVGWSLGGLVAIELAHRHSERVLSLATFNTNPRYVAAESWPAAMPAEILDKFAEVFAEDNEGTLIRFLALNCKDSLTQAQDVEHLKNIMYFCGLPNPRALAGGLDILRTADVRQALTELIMPTLMLFGEKDNVVPGVVMEHVVALAPHVQVALLKDMAHVPFISDPELCTQALYDFYCEHFAIGKQ